jgi:hypothetical protein
MRERKEQMQIKKLIFNQTLIPKLLNVCMADKPVFVCAGMS